MAEIYHRPDEGTVEGVGLVADSPDEFTVNLYNVGRCTGQAAQGRVACAEVIHGQPYVKIAQTHKCIV